MCCKSIIFCQFEDNSVLLFVLLLGRSLSSSESVHERQMIEVVFPFLQLLRSIDIHRGNGPQLILRDAQILFSLSAFPFIRIGSHCCPLQRFRKTGQHVGAVGGWKGVEGVGGEGEHVGVVVHHQECDQHRGEHAFPCFDDDHFCSELTLTVPSIFS